MIREFITGVGATALAEETARTPWNWTQNADPIVRALIAGWARDYVIENGVARHPSAVIEPGATIKGAALIGPNCFISSSALLRGGCWLEGDNTIGPGCELKSSFLFARTKLAHLNFVGDSVIGADVNIEAGAMIANYRNERPDKRIVIRRGNEVIDTGVEKFGALVGDGVRIGANAVIAPGALIDPGMIVPRLTLIDMG